MGADSLLLDDREHVRTIQLNRPEKLNALTADLANAMIAALEEAERDDDVHVIVLTGAGRGFCAGLDLTSRRDADRDGRSRHERMDDLGWVGRQALVMQRMAKPVIAALNGAAAGAGLSIALAADVRLMAEGARLTTGYARRGLSPDGGMSWFLPRLVGSNRAADLLLTGRDFDAEEAQQIGLVAAVYPDARFREEVARYAADLAARAPIGVMNTKRLLASAFVNSLETQLKLELQLIGQCFATEDAAEGMRAFAEKRQPVFTGR